MIQVTLKLNKECSFSSPNDLRTLSKEFLVITGESGVTDFHVTFPEQVKDWAKRVEFYNAKNELDIWEFEGYEKPQNNELQFDFSLPNTVTAFPGYARLVFRASNGGKVFVWNPEPIPVTGDTFFTGQSPEHPDLLSAAYEKAKAAERKANEAVMTADRAEQTAQTAETNSASALEIMQALVQEPDNSEANNEGVARVEISADGRLKFISVKGITPKISIGEVISVPPDEKAEVTIRTGSSPEAPVFDIKLPQGKQGPPGSGVAAGMSPVPVYKGDWTQTDSGYRLEIGPEKHHLGATNILTAEANMYVDGTSDLIAAYDSPVKTNDGIIRLFTHVPWDGLVLCSGGSATAIDVTVRSEVAALRSAMENESHFRGYVATQAAVQALAGTANDYAYCAADGKVWVYGAAGWSATNRTVPDQMVPKGKATPLMDGEATTGDSNTYADALHRHPTDSTREPAFTKNTAFNKNFGTEAGTVCEGDDSRLVTMAERTVWNGKETPAGAQAKADAALSAANTHTDEVAAGKADKTAFDSHAGNGDVHITVAERSAWNSKETPAGAQTKADAALSSANAYSDAHAGDKANPHGVTPAQIGLGNVDNTRDADKSVAAADALNVYSSNELLLGKGFAGGELYLGYRGANAAITTYRFCDGTASGTLAAVQSSALFEGNMRVYSPNNKPAAEDIISGTLNALRIPSDYLQAGNNIALSRDAAGKVTITASFGTVAPYKKSISAADWSGSASTGYTVSISASTHGKGADPVVDIYDAAHRQMYDSPTVDDAGNVTLHSRAQVTLYIKIR